MGWTLRTRRALSPPGDYKAEENALYRPWLLRLIREVSGVEGIERIRLGSLEPRIITGGIRAAELARLPKLCPHFHLSSRAAATPPKADEPSL